MKSFLFDPDGAMTPEEILDNLEAENCGVEENYAFLKPYTDEEAEVAERSYLQKSKELSNLEKELATISAPIKEKMKPLKKECKHLIESLNKNGTEVREKVYLFPDYDSKMMGIYDSRGILVGTRVMSRAERQLHINSHLKKAI